MWKDPQKELPISDCCILCLFEDAKFRVAWMFREKEKILWHIPGEDLITEQHPILWMEIPSVSLALTDIQIEKMNANQPHEFLDLTLNLTKKF